MLLLQRSARHAVVPQGVRDGLDVIAHQVKLVTVVRVGGVYRDFGSRQTKDQPSLPGILADSIMTGMMPRLELEI